MSTHDRGTFGKLLQDLREMGFAQAQFRATLYAGDEDARRWCVQVFRQKPSPKDPRQEHVAHGRTGEEALRRLVEGLRVARDGGAG